MDKEAIARVAEKVRNARATQATFVHGITPDDLDAILALQSSERGEGIEEEAERIVSETYKPAGGDYLWSDVVGAVSTAIAEERGRCSAAVAAVRAKLSDDVDSNVGTYAAQILRMLPATLSPAEPSPESREDFYANLYARSCGDVLRVRAETIEECAKVAEATTDDPPESMYEHAYDHAAHHIAAQIRALSAPAHD